MRISLFPTDENRSSPDSSGILLKPNRQNRLEKSEEARSDDIYNIPTDFYYSSQSIDNQSTNTYLNASCCLEWWKTHQFEEISDGGQILSIDRKYLRSEVCEYDNDLAGTEFY